MCHIFIAECGVRNAELRVRSRTSASAPLQLFYCDLCVILTVTLFALIEGFVKYENKGQKGKFISVDAEGAAELQPKVAEETAV